MFRAIGIEIIAMIEHFKLNGFDEVSLKNIIILVIIIFAMYGAGYIVGKFFAHIT